MNNRAISKNCTQCGQAFTPTSNVAKLCPDCRTFRCGFCGQVFTQTTHRKGRTVRFCSRNCTNAWQRTEEGHTLLSERKMARDGNGHIKECETCHQPFYVPVWRARRPVRYCSHACRNYHLDATRNPKDRILRLPSRNGINRLERAGKAILDQLGVTYSEQEIIGAKFVVDALIPHARLVIQWDGDFWHANPDRHTSLCDIQRTNVNRDKACNSYLTKCGYRVLRFWESDVHESPSSVLAAIIAALDNSDST